MFLEMKSALFEVWDKTLELLAQELSPLTFTTWFKPLVPVSFVDGIFVLEVKDDFSLEQVQKYQTLIENALLMQTQVHFEVRFQCSPFTHPYFLKQQSNLERLGQSPLVQNHSMETIPQPSKFVPSKTQIPGHYLGKQDLKPEYTFNTFVVGDSNRFAHAACLSVAENQGNSKNNPLFIYGGSGLGKTHLMYAIMNHILLHQPNTRMLFVPCERFVNEFISAIQKNRYDSFREKYRNCDILFIDDIQFIEDKEQTQIEFFNTFNSIYENGSNIVITCDKPPQNLKNLAERLRTRFTSGLIVDIQTPGIETRMAILEKLALSEHIFLEKDVLEFIANNIKTNVRELEGAFKTVEAYCKLMGEPITIENAREALKSSINPSLNDKPSHEMILDIVCHYFNLTLDDLMSKNKQKNIAESRQMAMYLLFKYGNMTYKQIGEVFGGKHHTTIMHGYNKVFEELQKENPYYLSAIQNLEKRILGK